MNEKDTSEFILDIKLPLKLQEVFTGDARYRGAFGGRGSAKSWSFADMALVRTIAAKTRMLCTRELQNSIKASVLQILIDRIEAHGLQRFYDYGESFLKCVLWDDDFIFKGLRHNYREIKSTEGVDIVWIEEAETTSEESFRVLFPTIRKPGSEIWLTWNSESSDAPIHKRFVLDPPDNAKIAKVNWVDNPWFPEELEQERLADLKRDPDIYAHVWEGECLTRTDAQVLAGKWRVDTFERHHQIDGGPYYGCDWGFSTDPMALVVCYIVGTTLFIDQEAGGRGIEIKDTPAEFDKLPRVKDFIVRADNARPELISHMQTEGYKVIGAEKWPGSVEDGVTHLRSYDEIVIHERCDNVIREARLWSYKIDRLTGDVLPVLLDRNNHWFDGVRYALSPIIKRAKFTGKAVYQGQFNHVLHISLEELWPIKGADIVVGIATAGTTHCALVCQLNRRGQLRVIEEIIARDMGLGQFSEAKVIPALQGKYRQCRSTIVTFGERKSAGNRGADTVERLIIDEMEEAGLEVESVDSNLLGRRLESVRHYLCKLPTVQISPGCTVLIDGFRGGYQFKQMKIDGSEDVTYSPEPEKSQYVLPHEALQYCCMWLRGEMDMAKTKPTVSAYRTY